MKCSEKSSERTRKKTRAPSKILTQTAEERRILYIFCYILQSEEERVLQTKAKNHLTLTHILVVSILIQYYFILIIYATTWWHIVLLFLLLQQKRVQVHRLHLRLDFLFFLLFDGNVLLFLFGERHYLVFKQSHLRGPSSCFGNCSRHFF